MDRQQRRRLAGILVLGVFALVWVFFAPVQFGGSTLYSATKGDSMEPLFHAGDLAIVRRSASYRVGDIVLYESAVLHRPVLHRIIVIQNGHYFFKGDHNHFVDPGYATSRELLGKLWIHVSERRECAQLVRRAGAHSTARRHCCRLPVHRRRA